MLPGGPAGAAGPARTVLAPQRAVERIPCGGLTPALEILSHALETLPPAARRLKDEGN